MDGLVPLRGTHATPRIGQYATRTAPVPAPAAAAAAAPVASFPVDPTTVKTPADYLRAMRRRAWLILAVAVPLAIASSTWALRQPRIYQAAAEVLIDPPRYDPILSTLVSHDIGRHDPHAVETYTPNLTMMLKGRMLAEKVVSQPGFASDAGQYDDPAGELILSKLQVRPYPRTNMIYVTLEGRDPARTKKLLEELLRVFRDVTEKDSRDQTEDTKSFARQRLEGMKKDLVATEKAIIDHLQNERTIGPGGRNIFEDKYVHMGAILDHKQMKYRELGQQLMIAQSFPRPSFDAADSSREQRIAALEAEKKRWIRVLREVRRTARHFDSEPAAQKSSQRLNQILDELDELKSIKSRMVSDPTAMLLEQCNREIEEDRAQEEKLLAKMQDSMPAHQKFLSLVEQRDQTRQALAEMDKDIASFEILAKSQHEPVKIPESIVEPTVPIRPSRVLYIGVGLILSLGAGVGLVVMLEHVDHTVKVPEHVTQGLVLPLLGVVPRIRRTALVHRGGHLWTSAAPGSLEADAFRNIRASLLGVADRRGAIVTLLVTSPKAGDGKSTTALNLAATCARAGERTLLLDVDLRRPTLADVFPPDPDKEGTAHGLVDVLQGLLPWQKTLRHTELKNLDFIPTGDSRDIPIEILGTLELRQLLTALSSHYDRVILDGPAVLGMADCRVLGRMVDACVLVVRCGAHPLVTLQRTRAMLEQSHVAMAGVIVNNLSEGVQSWSSYGYDEQWTGVSDRAAAALPVRGAAAPTSEEDALALAAAARI